MEAPAGMVHLEGVVPHLYCVGELIADVLNQEHADYDLLNEEAQATRGWQVASSASELHFGEMKIPGVILIKGRFNKLIQKKSQDLLLTDPRNEVGGGAQWARGGAVFHPRS